ELSPPRRVSGGSLRRGLARGRRSAGHAARLRRRPDGALHDAEAGAGHRPRLDLAATRRRDRRRLEPPPQALEPRHAQEPAMTPVHRTEPFFRLYPYLPHGLINGAAGVIARTAW